MGRALQSTPGLTFPILGFKNFYKDTRYIWRLAKLTELYGDYNQAKKPLQARAPAPPHG